MSEQAHEQSAQRNGYLPRLVGRLSAVPADGGAVIHSATRRLVYRAGDGSVVQKMLSVLDGHHDHAAICAETGVGQRDLDRMLRAFDQAGLLEWDRAGQSSCFPLSEVRDYVSGSLVRPSGYQRSHQIGKLLSETAVILACSPEVSLAASADLQQIGLGRVIAVATTEDLANALDAASGAFASCLAVCQDDCGDRSWFDGALTNLMRRSWPVLRYQACPLGVEIGPLFTAGYPCCLDCFRSAQGHSHAASDPGDAPAGNVLQDPNFAAALLVDRLISTLVGDGSPKSWGRIVQTAAADDVVDSKRFAVVPDVSCARCGWAVSRGAGPGDLEDQAQSALASECLAESSRGLHPDRTAHAGRPAAYVAPPERKPDPPAPRYSRYLPSAVLDRTGLDAVLECQSGTRGYERLLSAALLNVAGDVLERFTADSGKKGTGPPKGGRVTPYLLASDDIFEIPGSVFRYEHHIGQMVSVSSERQSLARYRDAVGRSDGEPGRRLGQHPAARWLVLIFVGTGSFREPENMRAWRLAQLRTGCALDALASFARGAGVGLLTRVAVGQPALADLLELWPDREIVTAAVEIALDAGGRECH